MKCFAAACPTMRPVLTLPVKQTASTTPTSSAPVRPSPATKSSTVASSGTASMLRFRGVAKRGATSLGFTSTAQPASNAGMASISDSVSGKFHGLITPTRAYGMSCVRNVRLGCALDCPESSRTNAGACAHQRSIAPIVPLNSAMASRCRPVSTVSADDDRHRAARGVAPSSVAAPRCAQPLRSLPNHAALRAACGRAPRERARARERRSGSRTAPLRGLRTWIVSIPAV